MFARIFNILVILETLWTKSMDKGGGKHMKFLTFVTSLHKLGHPNDPHRVPIRPFNVTHPRVWLYPDQRRFIFFLWTVMSIPRWPMSWPLDIHSEYGTWWIEIISQILGAIHKPCGQFLDIYEPIPLCGPFY